jgi:hypothetical protein
MNAPVRISEAEEWLTPDSLREKREFLGDIEDFHLCCAEHRYFLDLGILAGPVAVDNLQWLAERWGLPDLHGQDEIQRIMAHTFRADEPSAQEIPLAPELKFTPGPYRTPQVTVDAFWHVTRLDDPDYLARWLARHPADGSHLFKLWKAKRC